MADPGAVRNEIEWRLCEGDFWYWFTNYWKVPVPRKGMVKPEERDYQREIAAHIETNQRSIAVKARQIGYTTLVSARAFHSAFFHEHVPWLIVSTGEKAARKTLARIDMGYSNLPEWMKERGPARTTFNQESMEFDNGSRIDSLPSTSASGRGDAVYGVIFDEAAHMQDAGAVFGALDPLCYGPLLVFSSANGMGNWFHDLWLEAQFEDSEWAPLFFPWSAVPARDAAWYARTKKKYRAQPWMFYQEYPSSPEEAFAKSGRVAYSEAVLADQDWSAPVTRYEYTPSPTGGLGEFDEVLEPEDGDVTLYVWEEPTVLRDDFGNVTQKPNYVVFCDTAEGLIEGDSNCLTVWNANTAEVVATMETLFPIEEMGELLETIGYRYHSALIAVERNNMGLVPLVYLQKARYPRLYRMEQLAEQKLRDRTPRYGWATTPKTKPKMVHDFAKALRDDEVTLHDEKFRIQAQTFVANGKGSYGASSGNHDDVIIAHIGGWQIVQDVGRYPIVWFEDDRGPATWADVHSIVEPTVDAVTQLGQGIGRRPHLPEVRKTIVMGKQPGEPMRRS